MTIHRMEWGPSYAEYTTCICCQKRFDISLRMTLILDRMEGEHHMEDQVGGQWWDNDKLIHSCGTLKLPFLSELESITLKNELLKMVSS